MISASVSPMPEIVPASLWTRKDLREFKNSLRKCKENVLSVSSLAIATVSCHGQLVGLCKLPAGIWFKPWHWCGIWYFCIQLCFSVVLSLVSLFTGFDGLLSSAGLWCCEHKAVMTRF